MNFCLSDLVPPLRWSDAATIPLLRDRPELPDAWWRSLPMAQVLALLDPERLGGILARIALEHWPAAAVGDILPALHVLDPEEADEPCTAIALDRTGSWPGLLALTGHELRDQPFIQAFPVLSALFTAVFSRIAHPFPGPAASREARADADDPKTGESKEAGETPRPQEPSLPAGPPESSQVPKPSQAPKVPDAPRIAEVPRVPPAPDAPARPRTPAALATSALPKAPAPDTSARPKPPPAIDTSARPKTPPAPGPETPAGAEGKAVSPPAGPAPGPSLHALLDTVFADLDDKSWAVAQNRVFSDAPAAVEALAKLFAVRPEVIQGVEADLRRRLGEWLASDEAAPYREHLASLGKTLGKAVPKARLIASAPWHSLELHSLDVPAWHFVLATLSGYHLADGWVVEGDITELRHRTRDTISGAKPPLTIARALDLVVSLGIHREVAKEWLENVPQLRILGTGQRAPQSGGKAGGNGAAPPPNAAAPARPPAPRPVPGPPAPRAPSASSTPPAPSAPRPVPRPPAPRAPSNPAPSASPPLPAAPGSPASHASPASPGGTNGGAGAAGAPAHPLKDVALTRRCFRQPDGRWWLRIDVTAEHIQGAECTLPSGFAAYLGMSPGTGRKVRSPVGEVTLSWRERPALESFRTLLEDAGARHGSHLFLTLSDEGVLRARHLPAAGKEVEAISQALRLVGYTAPGGTPEQAGRVIATRVGMTGPVSLPDLLTRLRERGDRDLLSLLA